MHVVPNMALTLSSLKISTAVRLIAEHPLSIANWGDGNIAVATRVPYDKG